MNFKEGDKVAYKDHPDICIGRIASHDTIRISGNKPIYRVFTSDEWFKHFGIYGGPNTMEVEEDDIVLFCQKDESEMEMRNIKEEKNSVAGLIVVSNVPVDDIDTINNEISEKNKIGYALRDKFENKGYYTLIFTELYNRSELSIEERAKEAFSMPEQPCLEAGIRDAMIKFAKEQQKIDNDKIYEIMKAHTAKYLFDADGGPLCVISLSELKQALEENFKYEK